MTQTMITPPHQNDAHEEYSVLMSLALDNLLDEQEASQLTAHLATCDPCNQQWQIWQSIDTQFQLAPMVAPPVRFVEAVEARIARTEARKQWRVGLILAVLTLLLWGVGFAGIGLLFGLLIYNQIGWFAETLAWLGYAWEVASVVGESIWQVLVGLSENPSTDNIVIGYLVLAVACLTGWSYFLRRSTRPLDAQSA